MHKLTRTFTGWLHGCIEILLFLPLLLAVGVGLAHEGQALEWTALLSLFYLAGVASKLLLQIRLRALQLLFGAFATVVVVLLLPSGELSKWLEVPLGAFLVYRGMAMADRTMATMYGEMFYWLGPFLYWIGSFFYRVVGYLQPYQTAHSRLGLLTLAIVFLMTNLVHLHWTSSTTNRNQPPGKGPAYAPGLLRQNRLLLGGLLVLIVLLSQWKGLLRGIYALFEGVLQLISRLFLSGVKQVPEDQTKRQVDPQLPFDDAPVEPSPILKFLEKVAMIGVYVLLIAAALLLLYVVIKRIIPALRRLLHWLRARSKARGEEEDAGEGYVDEEESLDGWKQLGGRSAGRLRTWLSRLGAREPGWEQQTSGQDRARFLYKRLVQRNLKQGGAAQPQLTPSETGLDIAARKPEQSQPLGELVDAYNEARYGEREPQQTDLERIRRELGLD